MYIVQKFLKNKEILFFLVLLVLGSLLRLYRLPQTMQFLGDQGRDALIARAILFDKDPAFIGPVTSVGNMYLGPFYYYFMVLPLMLTYPSPVGPAYAVAIVGIVTLALIYILGKEMIGKTGAFFAMLLYAVSPVAIANVRFSWNPNLVPFFSLIAIWAVYKTWGKHYQYWSLLGICIAILFQLHYIALILIGCIGVVWLIELFFQLKNHHLEGTFVKHSVYAFVIFILSLTPLILFDTRHDWLNVRAFLEFFHPSISSQSHFRRIGDVSGVLISILSMSARVIGEFFSVVAKTFSQKMIIVALFLYMLIRANVTSDRMTRKSAKYLLSSFLLVSVLLLSLYSGSVFDHYLGFIFPISLLTLGFVLGTFWRQIFLRPLVVIIVCGFVVSSLFHYPGLQQLGSTVFLFERSSQIIATHIPAGTTYNLLSYSPTKDLQAMNYRYFLTTLGKKPADPDDWQSFSRLYIVDEEHRPNPIDEEQYVIKIWPNRTIVDQFSISNGPDVYVLERN